MSLLETIQSFDTHSGLSRKSTLLSEWLVSNTFQTPLSCLSILIYFQVLGDNWLWVIIVIVVSPVIILVFPQPLIVQ